MDEVFEGTLEEYEEFLNKEVDNGNITEEVADAMFAAFSASEKPESLQSIVETQQQEFTTNAQAEIDATNAERPWWDTQIPLPFSTPTMSGASDEALQELGNEAAQAELTERERIQKLSFLDTLTDIGALERIGKSAMKSPSQLINGATIGIPALIATGASAVTGSDLGGKALLADLAERNETLNALAGVSEPLTPQESIAESLTGALVPGGLLIRGLGIGGDFLADQAVRELSDEVGEKYETVFDQLGLTDNNQVPTMGTLTAIGVVLLGGALSASALSKLSSAKITPPKLRALTDLDPNAPKNLSTLEKASDLTKTNIVDEQRVLKDIIRRNGIPDADDIDVRIEFDTHAAQRTRVHEAMNTGKLTTVDGTFQAATAPKTLYNAYNGLDKKTKSFVARYINLKDMRDDVNIAISKGQATAADLLTIDNALSNIEKTIPQAKEFSARYNDVTKSLREFAEGSLFSNKYKTHLDKTRSNYVPLEISDVDASAPFLQRLRQSQGDGTGVNPEWFQQNRTSLGKYDIERRADPFDMLMQSVEATLTARMKNDTKIAIIDSLLDSEIGSQTMRLATKEELGKHAKNTVKVYRNGQAETYLTSQLTANLMRFDPYIAKFPALFVPKRIFEQATVGTASITFAPVTAIRDAIGGRVTRPDGLLTGNPLDIATAVPKQLWAKAQHGIATHIEEGFIKGQLAFPEWMLDAPAQKKLADNMANSYVQSIYHQANAKGGFDASLMKNKIELGKGMLAEVKRSLNKATENVNIPGAAFAGRRISNMIDGFSNLFNAVQDLPRFAAIEKSVKNGMSVEDATAHARHLTGDVTKSGRVYTPTGERIGVDAVDQGLLNVLNKPIGVVTEVLRESVPFFNPMVQGNRRLLQSIVEDPIGFNTRAWLNIGMPSLAAFGWNEMLGAEYNDYAMQRRSAKDVVMNMYVGIPGKPPEEGIEIPMMHELLTYSAPFSRGLYGMARSENPERTRATLSIVAENILTNSLDISTPTSVLLGANAFGVKAPDSVLHPSKGYLIREDDLGLLPQNFEQIARTMFGGIGDTALHVANAFAEDPSMESVMTEMRDKTLSRVPIAKNVFGKKRSNVSFSIPTIIARQRFDAISTFNKYYKAFFAPKRFNEDGLQEPASQRTYTGFSKTENPLSEPDLPYLMLGPEQLQEVVNPLYEEFGEMILDGATRGHKGMTGLIHRNNVYSKYEKRLRQFNAGSHEALRDWHVLINGIDAKAEETDKLKSLLEENNIDLTKYDDRVKMINIIEQRRSDIITSQTDIFDKVEAELTAILVQRGQLPEGKRFDITKHLDPHDPNPLGYKQ